VNGYPRLYIGKAASELKKRVQFPIQLVTKESLSDFISYYSTIPSMRYPLVIEDLAYLPVDAQSNLLKFIEDSKLNIILLSSEDNVIHTILSRMSLVYKMREEVRSDFREYRDAVEDLSEIDADTFYLTYVQKQCEISPISYYYDCLLKDKPNKTKLLNILSK
jgi:hypothetical protein